jgi:hypothetical protein
MKNWNSKHCEKAMKNLKYTANHEYPDLDLDYPYLDAICHETKSAKALKLMRQAYYLGMARGIKTVDEGMTQIALDPLEMNFEKCNK